MNKYIGLMSGTSLDGVDASLIETDGKNQFISLENIHIPYPKDFRDKLAEICMKQNNFFEAEKVLTEFHIKAVKNLLEKSAVSSKEITAIGFHGQTIFHNPSQQITHQIGNAHLLAISTNIDVVHDFRKRDIIHGGQGAPLIAVFHQAIMQDEPEPVIILNIGGVANITYIDANNLIAFDTGPGNALIDDAMEKHFNKPFDENGEIAAAGKVDYKDAESILANHYYNRKFPKSLDRNEFKTLINSLNIDNSHNMIATLTFITSASIIKSLVLLPAIPKKIYLCGGGSKNLQIIGWLKQLLSQNKYECKIHNINAKNNFDPDYIESQGFAYLAARFLQKLPSSFPSTTGVNSPVVCGALIKAK